MELPAHGAQCGFAFDRLDIAIHAYGLDEERRRCDLDRVLVGCRGIGRTQVLVEEPSNICEHLLSLACGDGAVPLRVIRQGVQDEDERSTF